MNNWRLRGGARLRSQQNKCWIARVQLATMGLKAQVKLGNKNRDSKETTDAWMAIMDRSLPRTQRLYNLCDVISQSSGCNNYPPQAMMPPK